ncbi:hypothetical protein OO25_15515 [Phaeobacter sp. S60]|nr:hypothetical protein OO25_15515 [Phaeobacter sp. S60]
MPCDHGSLLQSTDLQEILRQICAHPVGEGLDLRAAHRPQEGKVPTGIATAMKESRQCQP